MEYSHKSILLTSPSRAFGSIQRYIQGPGELDQVFVYGSHYGDRFLFLVDTGVFDMIRSRVEAIEDRRGCTAAFHSFYGECCQENVDMLADAVRKTDCNLVVGVGGGKVLDTVKLVADAVDLPRIIIPTSASSDAPAADWAAVYDTKGVFIGAHATKRSTELVLVDSQIIAGAPARLFASGIADALVTWYEAMANERSLTPNNIGRGYCRTLAGMAIARESHDVLLRDGIQAYEAVKAKLLTPAVENVIEANILLSGLGFLNAGCACAHGVHNGISALENGEEFLHGEKVAFGLVCQLVLENAPREELNAVLAYLDALDLPVTLGQLHIEPSDRNLDIIVDYMMYNSLLIHREPIPVTADMVRTVILAADTFGRQYLERTR